MLHPQPYHQPPASEARADSSPSLDRRASAPPHVLVVDDNEVNLMVAKSLCEVLGFTCELASDGSQALDAVQARPFDLVLMDICMPGMDGVEATAHIRRLPDRPGRIPIIAVTANAEPEDIARYRDAGVGEVVRKPIDIGTLVQAIERALAASRAAEASA